jgi:hypothetical protein
MSEHGQGKRWLCWPGPESDGIDIDPEFQGRIPPLSAEEEAGLRASLDAQGCRDALTVWRQGKRLLVVDGHNRLVYCRKKGYPFGVVEVQFADRAAVLAWISAAQLARRNLSAVGEGYLRGKRYLDQRRQGFRSDRTSGQNDHKRSSERLAEAARVGEKTIRRAAKLAEAVDRIVDNCGEWARPLLLARDVGFTHHAIHCLDKSGPDEQRKVLEEVRETRKRPLRKSEEERKTIRVPRDPGEMAPVLLRALGSARVAELLRCLDEAVERQDRETAHEPQRCRRACAEV